MGNRTVAWLIPKGTTNQRRPWVSVMRASEEDTWFSRPSSKRASSATALQGLVVETRGCAWRTVSQTAFLGGVGASCCLPHACPYGRVVPSPFGTARRLPPQVGARLEADERLTIRGSMGGRSGREQKAWWGCAGMTCPEAMAAVREVTHPSGTRPHGVSLEGG